MAVSYPTEFESSPLALINSPGNLGSLGYLIGVGGWCEPSPIGQSLQRPSGANSKLLVERYAFAEQPSFSALIAKPPGSLKPWWLRRLEGENGSFALLNRFGGRQLKTVLLDEQR